MDILSNETIKEYKKVALNMLQYSLPFVGLRDLEMAVDWSISKRFKDHNIKVSNNYTNRILDTTIAEMIDYIISKKPIITSAGVMFTHHGEVPNPVSKLLDIFIQNRTIAKKNMFKYTIGSDMYKKYYLDQILAKRDANALYGALGQFSCMLYNIYIAEGITTQGRSYTSAALLFFESFLANNVKFGSLNEIITFINNIREETQNTSFNLADDFVFLGEAMYISAEECWYKIMSTCGFFYIPSEKDMQIVYDIIKNLDQMTITRLFFKNNLYAFFEASKIIQNKFKDCLMKLKVPFLDPNKPPKTIKDDLDWMYDVLHEYVYYGYQYIDRLDRVRIMPRDIDIITDTDSNIISLDRWYNYAMNLIKDCDIPVSHFRFDCVEFLEKDEFGDYKKIRPVEYAKPKIDYSFFDDSIIELERMRDPIEVIPQDALRHSIINIMSYILSKFILEYMEDYTKYTNSYDPNSHSCYIIMKNEFLFKRLLNTNGMKNYASHKELQEGHPVPSKKALSVMGLPITKSTLPDDTQRVLQKILHQEILNTPDIDQVRLLKELAIFEKNIIKLIKEGDKRYYKPATVKAIYNYEDPMRMQGIKATIAYNELKDDTQEALDTSARNAISIIKTDISKKTLDTVKENDPERYEKIISLMNQYKEFSDGITAIALPLSEPVPKWILQFVDYASIINDNLKNFPLESVGIYRANKPSINYTNILKL